MLRLFSLSRSGFTINTPSLHTDRIAHLIHVVHNLLHLAHISTPHNACHCCLIWGGFSFSTFFSSLVCIIIHCSIFVTSQFFVRRKRKREENCYFHTFLRNKQILQVCIAAVEVIVDGKLYSSFFHLADKILIC